MTTTLRDKQVYHVADLIYPHLDNFPSILVNNDVNIAWEMDATYSLEEKGGQLNVYPYAMVIYQELDLLYVYEDGSYEKIGNTTYTSFLNKEHPTYKDIEQFIESKDFRKDILSDGLKEAIKNRITSFGQGEIVNGCNFMDVKEEKPMSDDEFKDTFAGRIQERIENLYTELLTSSEFDEGKYRIEIDTVEVGYTGNEGKGWGVLLGIKSQKYSNLQVREHNLVFHTGLMGERSEIKVPHLKRIVLDILTDFKGRKPSYTEFGVQFEFKKHKPKGIDLMEQIKGNEYETEKWLERMKTVLSTHQNLVQKNCNKVKRIDGYGVELILKHENISVFFGVNGIIFEREQFIYIKGKMNIQKGLQNLGKITGRNNLTLDIMRTYDMRTKIEEG